MTNEEAIRWLRDDITGKFGSCDNDCDGIQNLGCDSKCLSLKALDIAIKALEKQIAKKPKSIKEVVDLRNGHSVKITETYRCPECDRRITKGNRCYGLECGQKIDWSDYE